VVYGGVESVGHESGSRLDERSRLNRRHEARNPREKYGKIEKVAEKSFPVVAYLKRLDVAGAFTLRTGEKRFALRTPPGQDLQPQEHHEDS